MNISLNGESRQIDAKTLAEALIVLGFDDNISVVATALNGEFVSVANRASTELHDGDKLEVLAPMQGG